MDWHIVRASITLVSAILHVRRLVFAVLSISFFWAMGAVLAAQFPPLVKNSLGSDQTVATLFLAVFSVGVAIGSVLVNLLLKGNVSARYSPASALAMGVFVLDLFRRVRTWPVNAGELHSIGFFFDLPNSWMVLVDLLGVAVAGGMFVVPLYAFLTTTVPKSETARTIAANNIVNAGFMVAATGILAVAIGYFEITVADSLLIVAVASIIAAWLGWKLHRACD
jgi:MFS family permease